MNVWYSFLIALSMYSKIPLPPVEWTKARMKYTMCFFPVVGLVCGGGVLGWFYFAWRQGLNSVAAGMLGTCLPVLITGGIHLDGLLDTLDARSSYGSREKKLEILKDPHTGAFAILGACVYFLLYAGCLIQLFEAGKGEKGGGLVMAFCLVFPLERAFSGLSVVCFPCAKDSGLARMFSDSAARKITGVVLALWIAGISVLLLRIHWKMLLLPGAGLGLFFYYRRMAKREFGGITGDLAGWFLQIFELVMLGVLALGGKSMM